MNNHVMFGVSDGSTHLGQKVCNKYVIQSGTAATLEIMNRQLNEDDKTLRTYRRALAFSNVIEKDLIPIMLNCIDEPLVFSSLLKLFVNLTLPIECIFPAGENLSTSSKQTVILLNNVLSKCKVLCSNGQFSWVLMGHLSALCQGEKESKESISIIHNCLLLIRNVLHIPETVSSMKSGCGQNQIIWNLFSNNLDKVMLELIGHKSASVWCSTIVHIIAILFKDQYGENMAKLLNSSLAESSTDGESNTSPNDGSPYRNPESDGNSDDIQPTPGQSDAGYPENFQPYPRSRSESVSSLEVFPNASPAQSIISNDDLDSDEKFGKDQEWGPAGLPEGANKGPHSKEEGKARDLEKKETERAATTQIRWGDKPEWSSSGIESIGAWDQGRSSEGRSEVCAEEEARKKPCWSAYREARGAEDKETKQRENGFGVNSGESSEGEPPEKKSIHENADRTLHVQFKRNPRPEMQLCHKDKRGPAGPKVSDMESVSDSSETMGVPKKTLEDGSKFAVGFVSHISTIDNERQAALEDSTSSNDDDMLKERYFKSRAHLIKPKPRPGVTLSLKAKSELRRMKLLKQVQENRIRCLSMQSIIGDKEIAELLKEFTVAFLITGYPKLVGDLKDMLSEKHSNSLDHSNLLWLLSYFLQFASQIELDLDQIGSVLSVQTIAFLTFEGVDVVEVLELAAREPGTDISPHLRRIHLVVTAIREFLQTVNSYSAFKHLDSSEKAQLEQVQVQIASMKGLRQLLLLLMRTYNPEIQSVQYLADVVVCNHLVVSSMKADNNSSELTLKTHLTQFANTELMRQYGRLLVDYRTNSEVVNDCIFTMMHHVAGDLEAPHTLHIPSVLNTFSTIWEEGLDICEDWFDLIEYIIQMFLQAMRNTPHSCAANIVDNMDSTQVLDGCGMTGSQASQLFWVFSQVENMEDPVGSLIEVYRQTDHIVLSRMAVIQSLLSHGVITHAMYMNFIYMNSVMPHTHIDQVESVIAEVGSVHNTDGMNTDEETDAREINTESNQLDNHQVNQLDNSLPEINLNTTPGNNSQKTNLNAEIKTKMNANNNPREISSQEMSSKVNPQDIEEINVLKECLIKQGQYCLISWVQEVLLDACRVKLNPETLIPEPDSFTNESVPFYYNHAKQSIPLVPYNRSQYQGLQTESFILLLHKLGFLLPADVGKAYPRIPYFWSAEQMHEVASKLGPLREGEMILNSSMKRKLPSVSSEQELNIKMKKESPDVNSTEESSKNEPTQFMDTGLDGMDLTGETDRQVGVVRASWLQFAKLSV